VHRNDTERAGIGRNHRAVAELAGAVVPGSRANLAAEYHFRAARIVHLDAVDRVQQVARGDELGDHTIAAIQSLPRIEIDVLGRVNVANVLQASGHQPRIAWRGRDLIE